VEGPREGLEGEKMPQTQVRTSPVEVPAPGSRGGWTSGGAAPGPRTRETISEAEAAHVWRAAAEAETDEARKFLACPRGEKGGERGNGDDRR